MAIKRYNSGIQRAKGLLEIAAALYDSSLSHQTRRAAEGALQTDTRVGRVLRLSLGVRQAEVSRDVPVSFATGRFQEIIDVARGKYSLAWVNPSVLLTMAYRGKGPFKERLPLRTIAGGNPQGMIDEIKIDLERARAVGDRRSGQPPRRDTYRTRLHAFAAQRLLLRVV